MKNNFSIKQIKFSNYDFQNPFQPLNSTIFNQYLQKSPFSHKNNIKKLFSNPYLKKAFIYNNNNLKNENEKNATVSLEHSFYFKNLLNDPNATNLNKNLTRNRSENINYISSSSQTVYSRSINIYTNKIHDGSSGKNKKKTIKKLNQPIIKKIKIIQKEKNNEKKKPNLYLYYMNKIQLENQKKNIINSCLKIGGKYNFNENQMNRMKFLLVLSENKNNVFQMIKIRKKLYEKNEELKQKDKSLIIRSLEHKTKLLNFKKKSMSTTQKNSKFLFKDNNIVLPKVYK
jgi:hypothetical protein